MTFGTEEILIALLVTLIAGLVHGAFGLGFPMIATPILALITDVKTAILLTLAPNIAVNVWSLVRGGNWLNSVSRFWPVAMWMLVGSALGTLVLVAMDPNPFRLLLAATVVLYLVSDRIKRIDWRWIGRHPRASGAGAGLLGGLLGGTVNVGGPVMMIYFLELRLAPVVLVQAINLCFLLGKGTQAITFAFLGMLGLDLLLISLPLGIAALIGLRGGMWIRERVAAETYRGWLKALLWVLCILLVVQFFRELG
ncbi:sulfite exporter TauE/SafE family protein [Ectothiorhodospira lacustris]|uniref:sulfite exporter TauE/SafE family protein n=1 Tax=Ectothiorhodospira lacustris TaxID=2899127 RepID=UPI001EE957A6|nr:sulfite exporter TauE/SafE family protein [Ectothiorhodospira lacustris]MCG5499355.1 sulfite exporter TauE/SafE family protein [Ectothiorhodospira lacustris]MCG5509244.1 sulfite exporter TauE/SafE family protein [Ectothiorhodospira lacustris]MCG5521034.1 sulfite exporter TauE/SafE family protein [Ectothiorhodospira lacustris]